MERNRYAIHETLPIGILLTAVGGFLEAYTYLLRGGVFCNAQTGNIVLLALALAKKILRKRCIIPCLFSHLLSAYGCPLSLKTV